MLIVFGTYSFPIKKYTSDELGINTESGAPINIEIRQKIFHIFYIPVLPLDKIYGMRIDNKLYNLPREHHAAVDARGGIGTPWYSFALPILIILGVVFFQVKSRTEKYHKDAENKRKFEANVADLNTKLPRLSTHDYIELINKESKISSPALFLRVVHIKNDNVICVRVDNDMYAGDAKPYQVDAAYRAQEEQDTVMLSRAEIAKAYSRDFESYEKQEGFNLKLPQTRVLYSINRILDADAPSIYVDDQFESGGHNIVLKNFGQPVILSEMKNLVGSSEWVDTLPIVFDVSREYDQEVMLQISNYKLKTPFKTLLVFDDTLGNSYKFTIDETQKKTYATRIY